MLRHYNINKTKYNKYIPVEVLKNISKFHSLDIMFIDPRDYIYFIKTEKNDTHYIDIFNDIVLEILETHTCDYDKFKNFCIYSLKNNEYIDNIITFELAQIADSKCLEIILEGIVKYGDLYLIRQFIGMKLHKRIDSFTYDIIFGIKKNQCKVIEYYIKNNGKFSTWILKQNLKQADIHKFIKPWSSDLFNLLIIKSFKNFEMILLLAKHCDFQLDVFKFVYTKYNSSEELESILDVTKNKMIFNYLFKRRILNNYLINKFIKFIDFENFNLLEYKEIIDDKTFYKILLKNHYNPQFRYLYKIIDYNKIDRLHHIISKELVKLSIYYKKHRKVFIETISHFIHEFEDMKLIDFIKSNNIRIEYIDCCSFAPTNSNVIVWENDYLIDLLGIKRTTH